MSKSHNKISVHGPNSSPTGEEATLDVSYGSAMSNGLPVTFWSTKGTQPGNPENEPFLQWLSDVSSASSPPLVFSISYSDDESGVEASFAQRVNVELQKAGARGLTIIDSSGDGGVGGTQPDNRCAKFQPTFPAASPYVTAVGGTDGGANGESASTVFPSGGGFSNMWSRPSYQVKPAQQYLSTSKVPSTTLFNITGAGYPDVAMNAQNFALTQFMVDVPVSGTSCSAPSFAAVVALLNDARMASGKSSLGWLNPLIYAHPEAFTDITKGSNPGCAVDSSVGYLGTGFLSSAGWDPGKDKCIFFSPVFFFSFLSSFFFLHWRFSVTLAHTRTHIIHTRLRLSITDFSSPLFSSFFFLWAFSHGTGNAHLFKIKEISGDSVSCCV